nr:unnamed protein product [Callosobruchus analis]
MVDIIDFPKSRSLQWNKFLRDLRVDNLHFKTFCGMSLSDFDTMLNLVGPKIAKRDTTFRKSIPISERLAINLRYLASGFIYELEFVIQSFQADNIDYCSRGMRSLVHSIVDEHEQPTKVNHPPSRWLAQLVASPFDVPTSCGSSRVHGFRCSRGLSCDLPSRLHYSGVPQVPEHE